MPTYVFACPNAHPDFEIRCSVSALDSELHQCPACGESGHVVITTAPAVPTHIVLDYPGSKKHKAGYQHSHGDRKGTKIQSGYGGMITARAEPPTTDEAIWKNPLE